MNILSDKIVFPNVNLADENDILAIGGDLSTKRLLLAYKSGIFPWFNEGEPIIWYAPKNRMVLFPNELKISKSMKQLIKKNVFSVTFNQNFKAVITHCKNIKRKDQDGTWITDAMEESYLKLHELGHAKSVEVWKGEELVGGLYGIDLGNIFCGESMFSMVNNASKFAFITLVQQLAKKKYQIIDCQVYNDHLNSLGAREIDRNDFMNFLK